MRTIQINLGERSYPIHVQNGLHQEIGRLFKDKGLVGPVLIVTDDCVMPLYGAKVSRSLQQAGYEVHVHSIPPGEENKSMESALETWNAMIAAGLGRKSTVAALGGGVVGDVAGFAASSFMRGIAFVQIPTSMIGQLDSSIGGKNGVNFPQVKNIVGTFYQPRTVLTDPSFLQTLPKRELASGFGEVVKYALLTDEALFAYLEQNAEAMNNADLGCLEYLITRCAQYKAGLIEVDERDEGARAVLNLGHTVGHAIEKCAGYGTYRHGEAVAAGLVYALEISRRTGTLNDSTLPRRVHTLLKRLKLPMAAPELKIDEIMQAIQLDKKVTIQGKSRFILPVIIGQTCAVQVEPELLRAVLVDVGKQAVS